MIFFTLIGGLMFAGVLVAVLTPLFAAKPARGAPSHSLVAAVCRDQLRELEQDLVAGSIQHDRYDEARMDIERRLLADLEAEAPQEHENRIGARSLAVSLGLMISTAAIAVYWMTGSPQSIAKPASPTEPRHAVDTQEVQAMIARLASRLEREPQDAEGWAMLARSHGALARYADAVRAYSQAVARGREDPQLLADYADALAMTQGRRLQGEPETLIARALAADPNHVKALALAGSAAFEQRQYHAALRHWQRLLTRVPADAEIARSTRASIAQAQERIRGVTGTSAAP